VSDHLIIVRTAALVAALHVDQVLDLVDVDDSALTAPDRQINGAPQIAGVATLPDGLLLIHDVDTFLSAAESASLDAALDSQANLAPSAA
jgi:purine-binding chemotaxis protein CheW